MFKRHIGITSLPVNNIFTVNNAQHTYYTMQIVYTLKLEKQMKKFINCLVSYNKYMESYIQKK